MYLYRYGRRKAEDSSVEVYTTHVL
jgi:hypothetical protein